MSCGNCCRMNPGKKAAITRKLNKEKRRLSLIAKKAWRTRRKNKS